MHVNILSGISYFWCQTYREFLQLLWIHIFFGYFHTTWPNKFHYLLSIQTIQNDCFFYCSINSNQFLQLSYTLTLYGICDALLSNIMISKSNMKSSQVRTIYPDLATSNRLPTPQQEESFLNDSRLDEYSISSSDDQRYFFSGDLQDIKAAYLAKEYQEVVLLARQAFHKFSQSARSELIKKNVANLTLDLSKLRSITANAYLHLYREEKKQLYLLRARNCLNYEYQGIETPYRRAQRLNNLGLCQLLRGRSNNAFQHFSSAFRTYLEDTELRLTGLVKNIAEVYKQLEMYSEAVRYFTFVLEELDTRGGTDKAEYACIVISAMECINQTTESSPLHQAIYQRVKQLLPKMDKEKTDNVFPRAKLRLELLKFGVGFGITAKCIEQQEIQGIFHEVFSIDSQETRLKFLKGQCCYAYREHFRGCNWQKFRELSRLAEICFNSALRE